jgi:uncharacterized lipoprotein YbaY
VKALTIFALSLLLTACSLTPRQKAMVLSTVALSVALSVHGGSDSRERVSLPSDPCASPEACR